MPYFACESYAPSQLPLTMFLPNMSPYHHLTGTLGELPIQVESELKVQICMGLLHHMLSPICIK